MSWSAILSFVFFDMNGRRYVQLSSVAPNAPIPSFALYNLASIPVAFVEGAYTHMGLLSP